ncbi:uncharacterized protein DUF3108 [Tahibacter aquaticus]|uniref:Uncharacterized protein DUF3108 n=1 Tax=Tahibacter aquaticus TaxID=520092 RepID=A0A4R6Z2J6_9GAMM|nr:DUF6134 family protein [Tahibacter aquaticus]TDR45810.1 uncharacterized protein DUF3108 [Tahibacter aquaticus]
MRILALLGLAALPLLSSAVELNPPGIADPAVRADTLQPFSASYDVKRGDKVIGQSTMTLRRDGDNQWSLVTETKGTAGMARLLGLDVREESKFRVGSDGRLESTDYRYRQDATLKSKQRSIVFDTQAREVRVTDKDQLFRYALQPAMIDRQVVVVALGRDRAQASQQLVVANKDAAENQRYERRETSNLALPAGNFRAIRFERSDKPGKSSTWYAADRIAPLQVEQAQKDGENIVMLLRELK